MFRKITDRLNSAAASVMGGGENADISRLTAMGFSADAAQRALQATDGNVDRAAELLLVQGTEATRVSAQNTPSNDAATLQRVLQESRLEEEQRQYADAASQLARPRTAAMNKAAEAAARRAQNNNTVNTTIDKRKKSSKPPAKKAPPTVANVRPRGKNNYANTNNIPLRTKSGGLSAHHPNVKLVPKLADKSKEEQIIRCADRVKSHPQAVDTLYKALSAVQKNPENAKFRKVDKTTAGYQRSLASAPGAEDLLLAMNYRQEANNTLVLDTFMVDPALLYLGVSALEQAKLTAEYKDAKARLEFSKQIRAISDGATGSDAAANERELLKRAQHIGKCPTEPAQGRGALIQIVMADETIRRRFDGDDTLGDVLNWVGGHGSAIVEKIQTREWSLVDKNRFPLQAIDAIVHANHTLQFIGCWPSGLLEVVPSSEEWMEGMNGENIGSSRGLAAATADAM